MTALDDGQYSVARQRNSSSEVDMIFFTDWYERPLRQEAAAMVQEKGRLTS